MKLWSVEVSFVVPVWAADQLEAERLARGELHLSDYDCNPSVEAWEDPDACEADEVPVGARGKALSELLGGEG